jgi:hypothetical protein
MASPPKPGAFHRFLTVYDGGFHTEVRYGIEEMPALPESILW